MSYNHFSPEKVQPATTFLPTGSERPADEQKSAYLDPGLNLSGDPGVPVLEQKPASADQRPPLLDEDELAQWELIHMDGEKEVRFETASEPVSAAVPSGKILSGEPVMSVLEQQPHSDSPLSEVQRQSLLDVGVSSDERHHSFARLKSQNWIAKGQHLLHLLYQANDADLEITFNDKGYPQFPQCVSAAIKGLHGNLELGRDERQEADLAHSAATIPNLCADINQLVRVNFFDNRQEEEQFDKSRNDYLAAILCIIWALYSQAEVEVQRGSYKIMDQNHQLYKFLKNYVKFANKTDSPSAIMPYGMSLAHPMSRGYSRMAYSRTPQTVIAGSSHYKRNLEQFGIDLRFGLSETALELFPNQGTHLLFGDVSMMGEMLTFLKIEGSGLGTLDDVAHHSVSLACSGTVEASSRREKDNPLMPEWLGFCQAAGLSVNPKDQVPVHQMYLLMNSHELHKMHLDMGGHLQLTNPVQIARQAFLLKAIDLYGPDISLLAYRTGHEVFLDLRPALDSSYQLESSRASMVGGVAFANTQPGFFKSDDAATAPESGKTLWKK